VADIGSHWMQMVQMVANKRIVSVYGDATIFIPTRKKPLIEVPTFSEQELKAGEYEEITVDTEDHATVMFKFEGGAKGVMVAFQLNVGRKNRIEWEICGSETRPIAHRSSTVMGFFSSTWAGTDGPERWIASAAMTTSGNRCMCVSSAGTGWSASVGVFLRSM